MYCCGKHCEKRRNCLLQAISPFLIMSSTLYGTYFRFHMHLKMSSAICFNLDQSKILSFGNGLTRYNQGSKALCSVLTRPFVGLSWSYALTHANHRCSIRLRAPFSLRNFNPSSNSVLF